MRLRQYIQLFLYGFPPAEPEAPTGTVRICALAMRWIKPFACLRVSHGMPGPMAAPMSFAGGMDRPRRHDQEGAHVPDHPVPHHEG